MVKEQDVQSTTLFRPLHLIEQLAEETGTEITYAYDDLVFIENSALVLQFDNDNSSLINLFIDHALDVDERERVCDTWLQVAQTKHIALLYKGTFSIEQHPVKEELSIRFF